MIVEGRRFRRRARAASFALVLSCAAAALGDVIWVGAGTGRGFRQEVDIVEIDGDELVYLLNGNRATTPLARIQQMEITGEPAFNQAEQAFVAGDWTRAADNYMTYARRHSKPWVRRRAAERLIEAAMRNGRFDHAVTGYVQLSLVVPQAAAGSEPAIGETTDPVQMGRAANELKQVLDEGVSPAQARPLLALLLAIQNHRGDTQGAAEAVERLGRVLGPDSAKLDPELYAQVLIGRANLALSRGRLDEAVGYIEEGRKIFVRPRTQSDALMVLARVEEQRVGEDRAGLMDAALAYMTVVAHFKREEESPNVAEALLRAGQIHEKLGLTEPAAGLYRDLVANYSRSPFAAEARKRLSSLEG